jgi:hypothetical protein
MRSVRHDAQRKAMLITQLTIHACKSARIAVLEKRHMIGKGRMCQNVPGLRRIDGSPHRWKYQGDHVVCSVLRETKHKLVIQSVIAQ